MTGNSVTLWMRALEKDDQSAAQALFDRYFDRLVALARRKLGTTARRAFDEEDIAVTALYSCLAGVIDGRYPQLEDRDHLWRLLVKITERKVCDAMRKHTSAKRGAGNVRGESVFINTGGSSLGGGIHEIPDREPTEEFADQLAQQCEHLVQKLGDANLVEVATLVLAGYSTAEIARKTDRTQRTIQRRIKLIQEIWSSDDGKDDAEPR